MKISSLARIFLLGALFVGVTTAASGDIWNWMDNLSDSIPFGYATSQKVAVTQITATKVVLNSPVIQDELNNKILKYTVMYSEYPLAQILENTALLDQSKEKTFDFSGTLGTGISMELTTADGLDPNKVYYLSVIPKDANSILGEMSNELWIKLGDQTSGDGVYTASHGAAAGADMNLANVTHTINGSKITLKWTAVNGSDKVDIFLFDPTANVFNKLGTVNFSDEKYEFTATRNGEFIIKFMPNNDGREKVYQFVVSGVTTPKTTVTKITKVPKVGPVENIAVAFFIAFVLYILYRRNALKRGH